MASVHVGADSQSRAPWYSPRRVFVEGENFETRIVVKNDGSASFPPEEMVLRFAWEYPTGQRNPIEIRLSPHQIKPGGSYEHQAQRRLVLSSGIALLKLEYTPYDGRDLVLHDEDGQQIKFQGNRALHTFRGVAVIELQTLAGLYLAAIAAAISAVGLILAVLLR